MINCWVGRKPRGGRLGYDSDQGSDVNKTTSLKTKTKTTIGKTKTKTKVGKTYTKTNVIAADNVIINGKVAIIVSFLQHNILYVLLFLS